MVTGTILRIERFAIHDGPGIRTTVFLKGCPLRCSWCHSPESQWPAPEPMPLRDRCILCAACVAACPEGGIAEPGPWPAEGGTRAGNGTICKVCGKCVDACPTGARTIAGQEMSAREVLAVVERDSIFYEESGGGVTISGGEPLLQPDFAQALVDGCRERGIHVAVDTSGFGEPSALRLIEPDLFLFDLKAADEELHRSITGASNRVILKNLASVARRDSDVIVRFPLVPRVTDPEENVRGIGAIVSSLGLKRIDVLPYHRAGISKYVRLGRPYKLDDVEPPSPERIQSVVDLLAGFGLEVRVGG